MCDNVQGSEIMMTKNNAVVGIHKAHGEAETAIAGGCHHYAKGEHDAGLATGANNGQ
jgi:hypothetical protein